MSEILRSQWRAEPTTESQPVTRTTILDNQVRQPGLLRWRMTFITTKRYPGGKKQPDTGRAENLYSPLVCPPAPVQSLLPPEY